MLRSLLPCGVLCVSALSLGCAKMSYGERKLVDETVVSTRRKLAPNVSSPTTTLKQVGTEIRITAALTCDLVEEKDVRRTYEQERENQALVPELVLLSLGTVPAGLGAAFLIDSQNVYPNDRNARQYNASGKSGAIAGGIVLLAWGTAMMAVPVVDFVRGWGGSKEDETTSTEQGAVLRPNVPCEAGSVAPVVFFPIQGRIGIDAFSLGRTDASGVFVGDLVAIVPPRIFDSPQPPTKLDVYVGNTFAGPVDISAVDAIQRKERKRGDDEAWGHVNVIACRSASPDHPACDEVRAYIQGFPRGERAAEARKLLDPTTRSQSVQVAISPEDLAKAEAARKKTQAAIEAGTKAAAGAGGAGTKAAADACRKACDAGCRKDAACAKACVEGACQ